MKKGVYKIKNTITGKYVTLGNYSPRSSWMSFPYEAIRINPTAMKDCIVERFELTNAGSFNLKGEPQ